MPSKKNIPTFGSRIQVWRREAKKTTGGLTKSQLTKNPKTGKIVSKKLSALAKKNNPLGAWLGSGFSGRRKSPRRKSPRRKSPRRHTNHLHVTRTSLKRRGSPILHKHLKCKH